MTASPARLRLTRRGRVVAWGLFWLTAVVAGLALAFYTRGEFATWDGYQPLPTP